MLATRIVAFLSAVAACVSIQAGELSPAWIGSSPGAQHAPKLALSRNGALVIWSEERGDLSAGTTIRGMLLSASLHPVGDRDFEIPMPNRERRNDLDSIRVASNGTDFLVGYPSQCSDCDWLHVVTIFLRISADGRIAYAGSSPGWLASFAGTPQGYAGTMMGGALFFLDGNGRPVESDGYLGGYLPYSNARLHATQDGRLVLLGGDTNDLTIVSATWEELRTHTRELIDQAPTIELEQAFPHHSAASAQGVLIAEWVGGPEPLKLTSLRYDGTIAGTRTLAPKTYDRDQIALAAMGDQWVLVSTHYDALIVMTTLDRFTNDLIEAGQQLFAGGGGSVDAVSMPDGGIAFAVEGWNNLVADATHSVRVFAVARDGFPYLGLQNIVSRSPAAQEQGQIAQCGDVLATAWIDRNGDRTRVRVRRFRKNGAPIDPTDSDFALDRPVALHDDVTLTCGTHSLLVSWWSSDSGRTLLFFTPEDGSPKAEVLPQGRSAAVAFDGTDYVVHTGNDRSTRLTRWNENGQKLDQIEFPTSIPSRGVAVAVDGDRVYAASNWGSISSTEAEVRTLDRAFHPAGATIAFPLSQVLLDPSKLQLAANADGVVAAWSLCNRDSRICQPKIARITSGGVLLDAPSGVAAGTPSPQYEAAGIFPLQLKSRGDDFLLISPAGAHTFTFAGAPVSVAMRLPKNARPLGITNAAIPWLLYDKLDPAGGVLRLSITAIDTRTWTLLDDRIRAVRH